MRATASASPANIAAVKLVDEAKAAWSKGDALRAGYLLHRSLADAQRGPRVP